MKYLRRYMVVSVVSLLTGIAPLSGTTGDDRKSETEASKEIVPAELKEWTIRFDGFAGTPGDRSWFQVSLKYDGTIKVQKKRVGRGGYRTVLEKKLEPDETKQFFSAAAGIINEYKQDKSTGEWQDGWKLTLEISSESFKKSVIFLDQENPTKGPKGFDALSRIINRHLKAERFPE